MPSPLSLAIKGLNMIEAFDLLHIIVNVYLSLGVLINLFSCALRPHSNSCLTWKRVLR